MMKQFAIAMLAILMVATLGKSGRNHKQKIRQLKAGEDSADASGSLFFFSWPFGGDMCYKVSENDYETKRSVPYILRVIRLFFNQNYKDGSCGDLCPALCDGPCFGFAAAADGSTCTCLGSQCHENAVCRNGEQCQCVAGYEGDGYVCSVPPVIRVLDLLDSAYTPEEALQIIDPKDLTAIADSARDLVADELKSMITEEVVLNLFFPDVDLNFSFWEFGEESFNVTSPGERHALALYERESRKDPETRHELAVYEPGGRLLAVDFFDNLPEGCLGATAGLITSGLAVLFSILKLWAARPVAKAVATAVVSGNLAKLTKVGSSTPMFAQLFDAIELTWAAGSKLNLAKYSLSLTGYLFRFFGLKAMWQVMKDNMKPWEVALSGATIFLTMIALCATNGASLAAEIALLAIFLYEFSKSVIEFYDVCFANACYVGPLEEIECNDGDLCTSDESRCDASTNGEWQCVFSPVLCLSGFSCDPSDGICKLDDQLVPCVAVIDEDSSFYNQEESWMEFRNKYPNRPFCLLVPGPEGNVNTPASFLSDDLTVVYFDITRDYGNVTLAEDWVSKCGLDLYSGANVGWVGLFIDDSGSLQEFEVRASKDLFHERLDALGIQIKQVINGDENWILPFMTALAPAQKCITSSGESGFCLDAAGCVAMGKTPVPWQGGDPEPNCSELPGNIQCCVE